jgi:hypothetical protein
MGLSTTFKLNTNRQTFNEVVKSDFDNVIGTFLVLDSNNQGGQYPMTSFKIKVAYRQGNTNVLDAELYVMLVDLGAGINFLPSGFDVPNFFPIAIPPDLDRYPQIIFSDNPDIFNFFSISFVFNNQQPEGYYYDIIIHSPRLIDGVMIADVYNYTLYQ